MGEYYKLGSELIETPSEVIAENAVFLAGMNEKRDVTPWKENYLRVTASKPILELRYFGPAYKDVFSNRYNKIYG